MRRALMVATAAAAATVAAAAAAAAAARPDICEDTTNLSHCETVNNTMGCDPTHAYLRYPYPPGSDNFDGEWGPPIYPGTYINVRNEPYRRHGPRGVLVFYSGEWVFMRAECLSGGY